MNCKGQKGFGNSNLTRILAQNQPLFTHSPKKGSNHPQSRKGSHLVRHTLFGTPTALPTSTQPRLASILTTKPKAERQNSSSPDRVLSVLFFQPTPKKVKILLAVLKYPYFLQKNQKIYQKPNPLFAGGKKFTLVQKSWNIFRSIPPERQNPKMHSKPPW
jgi:hypothetical protein